MLLTVVWHPQDSCESSQISSDVQGSWIVLSRIHECDLADAQPSRLKDEMAQCRCLRDLHLAYSPFGTFDLPSTTS